MRLSLGYPEGSAVLKLCLGMRAWRPHSQGDHADKRNAMILARQCEPSTPHDQYRHSMRARRTFTMTTEKRRHHQRCRCIRSGHRTHAGQLGPGSRCHSDRCRCHGTPRRYCGQRCGASVIVVEANYDIGGHAILSGSSVPLGGGTSAQHTIKDSPDLVFADLTDWSIVQPNGWPDYRYNDRAVMRGFADHCAAAYEFLVANGVTFKDVPPDNVGAHSTGNSAPRENHAVWTDGTDLASPSGRAGAGLVRPLEASARAKGVKFLLNHKMTSLIRAASSGTNPGRVMGIAQYTPRTCPVRRRPYRATAPKATLTVPSRSWPSALPKR